MTDHPYSTPSASDEADLPLDAAQPLSRIARPVFLAWELLRIAYVAVLVLITLLLVGPRQILTPIPFLLILEGAIVANVLFFAGPVTETYIRWLGYQGNWVRWVLFGSGSLLAILITTIELLAHFFPGPG